MKIHINHVDIAYDDHGIGLPVIFLHAFPLHRGMWNGLMTELLREPRYRLVSLDWRGFGESSVLSDRIVTMDLLASDVAALMERLGMQRAILCGLSLGGYVAFAFLRQYPERVQGLILADTRADADTEEGRANREHIAQLVETRGTEAIASLQVPKLLASETRQQAPEIETRVRQMIATATPVGIAATSRGMGQRADMTAFLPTIHCPTRVIVGERDGITPPEVAHAYASLIPGAQVSIIPRAGHLSNLEQPTAFSEVVRSFLATI